MENKEHRLTLALDVSIEAPTVRKHRSDIIREGKCEQILRLAKLDTQVQRRQADIIK